MEQVKSAVLKTTKKIRTIIRTVLQSSAPRIRVFYVFCIVFLSLNSELFTVSFLFLFRICPIKVFSFFVVVESKIYIRFSPLCFAPEFPPQSMRFLRYCVRVLMRVCMCVCVGGYVCL